MFKGGRYLVAWRESYDIPNVRHEAPIPMASKVGNMVNTSWIPGRSMETGEVPRSVEEQGRHCLRNMAYVLAQAGAQPTDVLKVTVFIKSNDDRQAINPAWTEMFPDERDRPARQQSVIETLNYDIQIEAFAVVSA